MRILGILLISIFINVTAYADGIQYFDHVRSLYEQGRYEEAIQGFTACKKLYYEELDMTSIDNWISKCNIKIKERNAAIQARRQAEMAEAKRKAYEVKQQERIEKKLLYISSNAFLFDKEYLGMHQAIKGYIADNSEQRFTDDPEMAYWCVYVTANAYEFSSLPIGSEPNSKNVWYTSKVVAYIKIINEITNETLYEGEIIQSDARNRSTIDYKHSAEKAYRLVNVEIGNRIFKQIK